jgi:CxxC motif-containing protein
MRTIASGIPVEDGDFKLVSVRTDAPIPLGKIFEVMAAIKEKRVTAPVAIGDILIPGPAGTDCNIIATRNVAFTG